MWNWLVREWQWPAAALFAGLMLLVLLPPVAFFLGTAVALVFAQLPIYLIHQYEEHAGDRFRRYVNRTVGRGVEALTPAATFWINSVGVWGVIVLAVYLAWLVDPSAGLVAGYLTVINGIAHIGPALRQREYNPGVITAVVLFLPMGGACVYESGSGGGFWPHAAGFIGALAIHIAIVIHVVRRVSRLTKSKPAPADTSAFAVPQPSGV